MEDWNARRLAVSRCRAGCRRAVNIGRSVTYQVLNLLCALRTGGLVVVPQAIHP